MFWLGHDEVGKPRRPSKQKNEQPGSERIECAEVADALFAVNAPHEQDNVVRRDACGLVDEQQSFGAPAHERLLSRLSLRLDLPAKRRSSLRGKARS